MDRLCGNHKNTGTNGTNAKTENDIDPRISQAISFLKAQSTINTSAQELAKSVSLSESRFLHLFVEEFEITWRRYILWRRLLASIKYALSGQSLTVSAQHAGFSDSAHLSRVFKEMFGMTPSSIISKIQSEQINQPAR